MSVSSNQKKLVDAKLVTDIGSLRSDFPVLNQEINGNPLTYLDSAATSQRPKAVIDAMLHHEQYNHANVHRGVHQLSQRSTDAYEGARSKIRAYLNARNDNEIIFTRGTTESINLVASSLGQTLLKPGDEVVVTQLEHHSNIVPWQLICERLGACLVPAPITSTGEIDRERFSACLNKKTKIVALGHVSNALGTINPLRELIDEAHSAGALVSVDGAQAMPHMRVDVQALNCDFYSLSGHKMFGPTGIGILYGKQELMEKMPPYQGGGEMILTVSFNEITYNTLPHKFEAGTPNITGAIGLGAAVDYLSNIDFDALATHEHALLEHATEELLKLSGVKIFGMAANKASVLSFMFDNIHAHDLGTIVDQEGVAIRTGHHCAMPIMTFFGVPAMARASFALYNNHDDVDKLLSSLRRALEIFL